MDSESSSTPNSAVAAEAPLLQSFDKILSIVMSSPSSTPQDSAPIHTPLHISSEAMHEIVAGIATGKLLSDRQVCPAMLEALCHCVEYCCGPADGPHAQYQQDTMRTFRTLIPLLSTYARMPQLGPWIQRMLVAFYRKEGLVPNSHLDELKRCRLHRTRHLSPALQQSTIAALHSLRPYRPDRKDLPESFRQVGKFPEYRDQFKLPVADNTPDQNFPRMIIDGYTGHHPPIALAQPKSFHVWWKTMNAPTHPRQLLTDPVLQYRYVISPWSRNEETRLCSTVYELFLPSLSDDYDNDDMEVAPSAAKVDVQFAERAFGICRSFEENVLEPLPGVTQRAYDFLRDPASSVKLRFASLHNVSLLLLAYDDSFVEDVYDIFLTTFCASESLNEKLSVLDCLHRMIFDFEGYLPRLWELEIQCNDDEKKRRCAATEMFVQLYVASSAADVNVEKTLTRFVTFVDEVVREALVLPVSRRDCMRLWGSILRIWKVFASISTSPSKPQDNHLVLLPNLQALAAGLNNIRPFVSRTVKELIEKYLIHFANVKTTRLSEVKRLYKKRKSKDELRSADPATGNEAL
ncbi:uncharacterized protein LOC129587735 isoform X2 [Paramacrobiotus metropolitanus]|uniref:uncharacterized protein LOC129587735 isoform X2 n=1 Tax=Paramacrobiotus metropolitanus TaxID=2943436 RepID=UPI002446380B|nr:uncharacterized protein LOC129587735 isoform X2 [Paramacrobiotus metropolitanus]